MGASTPGELHELFKKFWDAKDLDGMLTLYEPDAILVGQDGTEAQGHNAIRSAFEGMFALGPSEISFGEKELSYVSDELALTHGSWAISIDGNPVLEAKTAEVARRGSDGVWRYVLDNPFGTALLG